jgi:hypothetical protein
MAKIITGENMSEIVERLKSMYITHTPSASYAQVDPVTIGEAADEITRLTEEVERLKSGYQGACYACEPVGELNLKLTARVSELEAALKEIRGCTSEHGGAAKALKIISVALSPVQPAPSAWRPIETPPPVGDQALYWTTKTEDDEPGYQLRFFPGVKCTHWMPLPPPPEKGGE